MVTDAKKIIESGLTIHPTKEDKTPLYQGWQNGFEPDKFAGAYGIGVIAGEKSGNLECMDFDNHQMDAQQTFTDFISTPEVKEIYDKYNLPVISTVSGGFHLLYRCEKIGGNVKLAQKPKWNEQLKKFRPDTTIEIRGEGGYFVTAPTKGYKVIRNSLYEIKKINPDERDVLISVAKSFNEWSTEQKTEYEDKDRPGDRFNSDSESISIAKQMLKDNGWTEINSYQWKRPGKDKGISATFGKVAENVFYCFTSNGYPFEPESSYTPFAVYALLKHNGNFKEAAKELGEKQKPIERVKDGLFFDDQLQKHFAQAFIDTSEKIDRPPTILYLKEFGKPDKRVFTLGNFSAITGKAKSRKSFFLTMITAAMVKGQTVYDKFLPEMPDSKRNVLYFDTEQGYYDSHAMMKRIEKIAGCDTTHFGGYNLRQFSPMQRCEIIEYALKRIHSTGFIVIDGIADLATAINDEDEATRVVSLLLRWTKQYNCHIATIIHQNKMNDFATGHLGSSIMKKCEVIVSVKKDEKNKEMSLVSCDMSRAMDFDDFYFSINDGIPEPTDYMPHNEL